MILIFANGTMKLVVFTKAVFVKWQEYNPFESTE
jgi:hypothetical protein